MTNKRILFIAHDPSLFGATRSLLDLQEGLIETGHYTCKTILPYYGGNLEGALTKLGAPFVVIPFVWTVAVAGINATPFQRLKQNIKQYKRLKRLNREFKPDIVYLNTSVSYFPLFFFKFWGAKTIFHLREHDYEFQHDWNGWWFKKALKKASLVLTNSQALKNFYKAKYGADSYAIYNGIATEQEFIRRKEVRNKPATSSLPLTLGMVGSINENKGQESVLNVFIKLVKQYNLRLEFYGSGPKEAELKAKTEQEGLTESVIFKGFVNDPDDIYRDMDILIMASQYEAFGRVTAEAISYGIPVIGFANGGTVELLQNGIGQLYDGTESDLQAKLIHLITDGDYRNEMANNAWLYAFKNFSREKYISSFISLIENKLK